VVHRAQSFAFHPEPESSAVMVVGSLALYREKLGQIVARQQHQRLVYLRQRSRDVYNYRSRDTGGVESCANFRLKMAS